MSKIILEEQASQPTPGTNKVAIYPKEGGELYRKNDTGDEKQLLGVGVNDFEDTTQKRMNLLDCGIITNAIGSIGGGEQVIDIENGNSVSATVDTSETTFVFSNPTDPDELCIFTLFLTDGASETVNWPESVDWADGAAPDLTVSGLDILVFVTIDGGAIWHEQSFSIDSKSP